MVPVWAFKQDFCSDRGRPQSRLHLLVSATFLYSCTPFRSTSASSSRSTLLWLQLCWRIIAAILQASFWHNILFDLIFCFGACWLLPVLHKYIELKKLKKNPAILHTIFFGLGFATRFHNTFFFFLTWPFSTVWPGIGCSPQKEPGFEHTPQKGGHCGEHHLQGLRCCGSDL